MLQPHDFQQRAVDAALRILKTKNDVLIVSPGGSGKTVMLSMLAGHYAREKKHTLIVSHRRELVLQAAQHLLRLEVEDVAVVLPDSVTAEENRTVRVGSLQTLLVREDFKHADVVIVDEAHHVGAKSYEILRSQYPKAKFIGLTATPFRLDRKGLGDYFHHMVIAAQPSELLTRGMLMKPKLYVSKEDVLQHVRGVRVLSGDYSLNQLNERLNTKPLVGNVVEHWERFGRGRKTLCFAVGKEHALALVKRFTKAGHRAAYVGGDLSVELRTARVKALERGEVQVLVNCMILSEGYDLPSCECVILARPTLSLSLYLQQAARAMRVTEGKEDAVIIDHGGNWQRFGVPWGDRNYELRGTQPTDVGDAPMKQCPNCGRVQPLGQRVCLEPGCGWVFVDPAPPEETDDRLRGLGPQEMKVVERNLRKYLGDSSEVNEIVAIMTGIRERHAPAER